MKPVLKHPMPLPTAPYAKKVATKLAMTDTVAQLVSIVDPAFPHITKKINELWGTFELQHYLTHTLVIVDRPNRKGFPVHIMSTLLQIYAEHSKIAPPDPHKAPRAFNPWESHYY